MELNLIKLQIGLSQYQIDNGTNLFTLYDHSNILGFGSKLNSAYVVIDQEIKTKPSAPTNFKFQWKITGSSAGIVLIQLQRE